MIRQLLLLAVVASAAASSPARALPLDSRLRSVELALVRWDLTAAAWGAERAIAEHPDDADAWLVAARVAFQESDYDRAQERAEQAGRLAAPGSPERDAAEGLIRHLVERDPVLAAFEEHESDNFILRVTPRDRLLVPYALATLEDAASAHGRLLGFCPDRKVVVEVYPSRRDFIAASTLTREEVETSGTVAICHFNRLMLISPAVMARGYDWLDTLAHEYVHYVVYRLGENAVPVWLQEGLAKLLEDRWRPEASQGRDPRASTILAEARESDRWVTFEEMHPSMAKLPSAALVSLAFAEVREAVAMLLEQDGPEGLRALVREVRDRDGDLDEALVRATGFDLAAFEARARAHVATLELYRTPGARYLDGDEGGAPELLFQDEGETPLDPEVEARRLEDRRARDWAMLGDRLKGRRFFDAALIEYDKALERLGRADPLLVNRKAHALLMAGRPAEAVEPLEQVLRDHPALTTSLDNLAEASLRLAGAGASETAEQRLLLERALELLRQSEEINPFNPDTHLRLAAVLERLGRPHEARRARERLDLLLEETR